MGRSPRRRKATGVLALLGTSLAVAGAGAALWRLSWMTPSWWSPTGPDDAQVAALADRVEYRLAEEAHKVRDANPSWRLRITEHQVNAWLAARLPAWVAHAHGVEWPAPLGPPQVRFADGTISVGVDLQTQGRRRVVVADLRPQVVDGELELPVDRIGMGRVWVPGGSVRAFLDRLSASAPAGFADDPTVRELIEVLLGRRRLDPMLRLKDGRQVRLLEMTCEEGAVILRCRTVAD